MALTRLLISGAGEVDDAWSAKTGDRNGGGGAAGSTEKLITMPTI